MGGPPLLLKITCEKCGWWCDATDQVPPNDPNILLCSCCPQWHNHDEAAEETGIACRPVSVMLLTPVVLHGAPPPPW